MKKQIFIIILFLICGLCKGQNLVPNPSFEDFSSCPISTDQVYLATGWSSYGNSSDYFNVCDSFPVGVPSNFVAYQWPKTGNAYCGLICYYNPDTLYKEYIGTQLLTPLTIGQKYYVSFFLNFAGTLGWAIACNKFGVLMSTVAYSNSNPPLSNNLVHFVSDSTITDSLNWTLIKGSFIADSSYQYMAFGNFFTVSNYDTINTGSFYVNGYYFIDDVCLSTDSVTCYLPVGSNEVLKEEEMFLFPNPFSHELNITVKEHDAVELIIYDLTGRIIINSSFRNSAVIKTGHLAKGLYLYEVRSREGIIKTGKIVKE